MAASPNDTVVLANSGGAITDASGNRWTISPQLTVRVNGLLASFTANVAEIAYVNGTVWHENTSSQWYSWNGVNWIAGNNPLPPSSTPGTSQILTAISNLSAQLTTATTAIISEIKTMGTTLGQQLTAAETQLATDLATQTTQIASLTTAVNALIAAFQGASAGSPVTQAMIDAVTAADQAVTANTASVMADTTAATGAV
jgi:hypothetical protein